MEPSGYVSRDVKYYRGSVASAPAVFNVDPFASPRRFSKQIVVEDRGRQSKYMLPNTSTESLPSIYSEKSKEVPKEVQPAGKVDAAPSMGPTFPEGGLVGWGTALGAFIIQFCGFGYSTSFGVFQDFYVREYLTKESSSSIAWIGSINAFLVISGGLLAGRVYDRGYFYALLWGGSAIISFSLFMLSLAQKGEYYQIFLSQGLGVGLGVGMIYVPSVAILSHYFKQRRSLVMTVVATGSSLGAVVHPIMLNNLLPKIGFAKATRANAGMISGLLLLACLIMKTRLPPPATTPDLKKSLVKFSKDKAYIFSTLGFFFFIIGFFYPIFYLQLDSITHHLSPNFAFYSLVVMNGCSCIGRIFAGFSGGLFGIGNLVVFCTACCSILIFFMIGISEVSSVVLFAVVYGFFSGAYIALMAPMIANLADDVSEIGLRMGISFTVAGKYHDNLFAFFRNFYPSSSGFGGLIGAPIQGALLTSSFIWWRASVFSGIVALLGCIMYIAMVVMIRRKKAAQDMLPVHNVVLNQQMENKMMKESQA
ncbi:Aspyridones efflux protein apdF [Psilocybe cubensis]|uniref:Aspyridones efflux protein apdF n=1 Tax=Psilocybe cubensis TaxID=181762 RepID=A0ACB8GU05_PSICU|nr:Aspyridones efflux protein apdF [Psilocybe cubensis]KAH9478949.1 Aspyridones efflux protein apdF [Psilocybe cubensis]